MKYLTYVVIDHCVGQVRMVFQPIVDPPSTSQPYLVYAQRYDCDHANAGCKEHSGLFRLTRAKRDSGQFGRLGAVVSIERIRCAVDVSPYFGRELANCTINCTNSSELPRSYSLNKYWNKETFYLLSSY